MPSVNELAQVCVTRPRFFPVLRKRWVAVESRRDELKFEIDVAGCTVGVGAGTLGDPSDQCACGVAPPADVKNRWCEADAFRWHLAGVSWNVLLSVSCSVRFWVGVVNGQGILEAWRRQEVTAQSEASWVQSSRLRDNVGEAVAESAL